MFVNADLSSQEMKHQVIPSLDVAKFICAIMVVMIHTRPFSDINSYLDAGVVDYIARLAVPFFFVTSGYLCFRKTDYENFDFQVPFRYAMKILKLYVIWTLIYSVPFLHDTIKRNGIVLGSLSALRTFIFSGYAHLWYLSGLVVAVLLVAWAVKKKIRMRTILLVGLVLYLLGLLGQSYFFVIKPLQNIPALWEALRMFRKVIRTTRNGFFEGILYVSIGMAFAYRKIVIKYSYAVAGFAVSMLLGFVEVFVIKYYKLSLAGDIYLFLIPAPFFLFYLVTHIQMKQTKITNTLRTYSMLIYYLHQWVIIIVSKTGKIITGIDDYAIHSLLKFSIVIAGAAIASAVIVKLSSYEKFKWVKRIY